MRRGCNVVAAACAALLWGAAAPAPAQPPIGLEPVTEGLVRSVATTHAGDGSGRLFIVQQEGMVRVFDGSKLLDEPFLDISSRVSCCFAERGMSGLAFHPDFEDNGYFYVSYMRPGDVSFVSRFTVSADPNRADPASELVLLRIPQPSPRHNVGNLVFGRDGYLYIGSGDGGEQGGDPNNRAQSLDALLGKILRIDVDGGSPYAIPPDNPFVDTADARGEIWAYGLRNPWRFSFDRRNGDLYVGDVGEDGWEEVNYVPGTSTGGENYGWKLMEGTSCFEPAENCNDGSLVLPILEYPHFEDGVDVGCRSVTGGFRYRGPSMATLPRFYLFADFCTGTIWGARRNAAGRWISTTLLEAGIPIVSFAEDQRGRLYVVGFHGVLYRVEGRGLFSSDFESGGFAGWSARTGSVTVVSPGLRGSQAALAVGLDGRAARSAVRSRHPDNETTFRVSFDFNANRVDLAGRELEILRLVDSAPHVKILLEPGAKGYRLVLLAREAGGLRYFGDGGIPAGASVAIALEWMHASAPGVADGEVRLFRNGKLIGSATGLDNYQRVVRSVALGVLEGSAGTGGGSLLFDNFRSTP